MTSKHDTNTDEKNSTPYPEIVKQENSRLNGSVAPNKDIAGPLDHDKGVEGTEVHRHDLANTNENTLTPSPINSTPDIRSSVTTDTFSDASQTFWGYIDAQKITQRTGVAVKNLPKFDLKEVLDNGCDTVEDNNSGSNNSITVNSLQPKITTWITKESKDLLRIVTRNTNYGNKKTFDRARLDAIFNYDNFHSSKLNQYKVTRGALGDAMKEWPTISYALTNNNGATEDKQWNHPLIIRHNKTEFKIQTHIDRSIKRIISNIEEVHDESIDNYTEVEFKLPIIPEIEDEMSLSNFWLYCTKYVLWSTHIAFEFHLSYDNRDLAIDIPATQALSSTFVNINSIYGYSLREFENLIYNIHDTKQRVFDALVNRKFREAGWNYFSSNPISKITIEELKSDPKLIKEIYDLLRHSMQPMRKLHVPYDVSAGGNNSKKSRKEGLIERFEAVKLSSVLIDIDRAVYKSVNGTVIIDSNNGKISNDSWNYTDRENNKSAIKFPFFFEILAIPIKYCEDKYFKSQIKKDGLIFFGGVNYSTTPADSSAYFSDTTKESYTYGYNGKKADGLIELLRECGYAGDWYNEHYKIEPSKQKQPCVVIAHLVSPKVEYLAGYGKSFINLEPYADTIAKATVELAVKMPSKLTYDKQLRDIERLKAGKSKDSIVFYLTELLQTRWGTEYGNRASSGSNSDSSSLFTNIIQVRSRAGWKRGDLSILRIDPWTQSTVWYFLKPILIAVGIPIKDSTREYVTSIIKDVCSKLEGSPTREELGIIASARAMLFFEGVWMSVDMDRVSDLAEKGTDLAFIEKRGAIEIVTKFIGDSGMSFCNTQGHFVYYAKDLAREFKSSGGHPSVTTDCDCAGINIAERVMVRKNITDGDQVDDEDEEDEEIEDKIIDERLEEIAKEKTDDNEEDNIIQRIGIDSDTLLYFGITAAEVEEEYPPKPLKDGKPQMNPGRNVTNPIVKMANKYWDNPTKFGRYKYIAANLSYLVGRTTLRIMADKYRQDPVKYGLFKTIHNNLEYLTGLKETPIGIVSENAKRIEIDSVIKRVGGEAFANYILDMHHIIFPERNFNRTRLKLKEYFGEKFDILPEPIKRLFIHATNIADAAAEKTEKQIESDQEHVKGFPFTVTDKKKENVNKISKAILKDPDMKLLISTIKHLQIIQYFDKPNIKEIAEEVGLSLKTYLHAEAIMEKGTKQQKQDWESGKRKTEAIYQEIMKRLITG